MTYFHYYSSVLLVMDLGVNKSADFLGFLIGSDQEKGILIK